MTCSHLDQIRDGSATSQGCEECLALGDTWAHLRRCLICGHVSCCDSSKNRHAVAHYHKAGRPIIQPFEPGESWRWRVIDKEIV
jgi:hypothetical protein